MKRWLGAIAISMVVSPALAQNAPSSDPSVPAMFQKFQDLKWEKINPEMGSKSAEIAVFACKPHYTSNRDANTYSKRHACAKALAYRQ
jgi:hypothetical protein